MQLEQARDIVEVKYPEAVAEVVDGKYRLISEPRVWVGGLDGHYSCEVISAPQYSIFGAIIDAAQKIEAARG
jgi:hypothetical protein